MKKSCDGCRAITSNGCSLGKETEVVRYSMNGYDHQYKPLEECEKPRTYKIFLELLKNTKG